MTRIIILDGHLSGTKSDETKEKVFEIESRTSDTCIAMVWAGGVPCTPVISGTVIQVYSSQKGKTLGEKNEASIRKRKIKRNKRQKKRNSVSIMPG